jgi:sporulation protein YlmC with PRC-barrel domain
MLICFTNQGIDLKILVFSLKTLVHVFVVSNEANERLLIDRGGHVFHVYYFDLVMAVGDCTLIHCVVAKY